jgi:hypothetical protein
VSACTMDAGQHCAERSHGDSHVAEHDAGAMHCWYSSDYDSFGSVIAQRRMGGTPAGRTLGSAELASLSLSLLSSLLLLTEPALPLLPAPVHLNLLPCSQSMTCICASMGKRPRC